MEQIQQSASKSAGHGAIPTASEQNHMRWSNSNSQRAKPHEMEQFQQSVSKTTCDGANPRTMEQFNQPVSARPLNKERVSPFFPTVL